MAVLLCAFAASAALPAATDTHVHFADLAKFHYQGGWVHTSHFPGDYLADAKAAASALGREVTGAVFVQASVLVNESVAEVRWVSQWAAQGGAAGVVKAVVGYASVERGAADTLEEVAALKEAGGGMLRGVRRILELTPPDGWAGPGGPCWFNTSSFSDGVAAVGASGMHFELLTRSSAQYDCALAMLHRVPPTVTVVAEHLAGPDIASHDPREASKWTAYVEALAAMPNVVLKVSGVPERADIAGKWGSFTVQQVRPFVVAALRAFGDDRVVYGGNWFVVAQYATLPMWGAALRTILDDAGASAEQREKLFVGNARRVYRL